MAQQVLEGTWEEIAAHAHEFTGKRLKVSIDDTPSLRAVQHNVKMLEAMQAAEEIQKGMNPKPDSDGVAIVREGRRGAMYGDALTD